MKANKRLGTLNPVKQVALCVGAAVYYLLQKSKSESKSCLVVSNSATPWTIHVILQARILEWVAFPSSRGSSQSRDQTQVSCIAGGFLTVSHHLGSEEKEERNQRQLVYFLTSPSHCVLNTALQGRWHYLCFIGVVCHRDGRNGCTHWRSLNSQLCTSRYTWLCTEILKPHSQASTKKQQQHIWLYISMIQCP